MTSQDKILELLIEQGKEQAKQGVVLERLEGKVTKVEEKVDYTNGKVRKLRDELDSIDNNVEIKTNGDVIAPKGNVQVSEKVTIARVGIWTALITVGGTVIITIVETIANLIQKA